jgi:predicted metalloprotease with PDZ domain
MTEATAVRINYRPKDIQPTISYSVAMPQPQTHLFEVTLRVLNYPFPILDLKFPVWTPGSYMIREYSRHLQNFSATTTSEVLPCCKVSKNHWQVETNAASEIIIKYRIFANEITVRTNHLDTTHGYFNGAALFFRLPEFDKLPIRVTIVPPNPKWKVTTALPSVPQAENTFIAADFDTLVDSPFEIGTHQLYNFEVNLMN